MPLAAACWLSRLCCCKQRTTVPTLIVRSCQSAAGQLSAQLWWLASLFNSASHTLFALLPTAAAIRWLGNFLRTSGGGVLLISHDEDLLRTACDCIVEIRGKKIHYYAVRLRPRLAARTNTYCTSSYCTLLQTHTAHRCVTIAMACSGWRAHDHSRPSITVWLQKFLQRARSAAWRRVQQNLYKPHVLSYLT